MESIQVFDLFFLSLFLVFLSFFISKINGYKKNPKIDKKQTKKNKIELPINGIIAPKAKYALALVEISRKKLKM